MGHRKHKRTWEVTGENTGRVENVGIKGKVGCQTDMTAWRTRDGLYWRPGGGRSPGAYRTGKRWGSQGSCGDQGSWGGCGAPGGHGIWGNTGHKGHGEDLACWEDLGHQEDLAHKENKGTQKLGGEGSCTEWNSTQKGKEEAGGVAPVLGSAEQGTRLEWI